MLGSLPPPPTNMNTYIRSQCVLDDEEAKAVALSASMISSTSFKLLSVSPIESCFLQRSFPTQKQAIAFIDHYRTYDRDIKVLALWISDC